MREKKGTLYLCATPIGNLSDMTPRVIETLRAVDLIACEDTRHSRKLFGKFDIHTPFTAYHHNNRFDKARELLQLLREGKDIALITDAGMPGISDPGSDLSALCLNEGIRVCALPGACALVTALALSGMDASRFVFEGFLPGKNQKKERTRILEALRKEERTIVLYEAPHHLSQTLRDLLAVLGDRAVVVCRELTKLHESVTMTTLSEALAQYEKEEARGEFVLVLEGASPQRLPHSRTESVVQVATENVAASDAKKSAHIALENKAAGLLSAHAHIAAENALTGRADAVVAVDAYNDALHLQGMTGEEILKMLLLQLDVPSHVAFYEARGMEKKEAMKRAAQDRGVSKREIYTALLHEV